jgi:hypothetical protein
VLDSESVADELLPIPLFLVVEVSVPSSPFGAGLLVLGLLVLDELDEPADLLESVTAGSPDVLCPLLLLRSPMCVLLAVDAFALPGAVVVACVNDAPVSK